MLLVSETHVACSIEKLVTLDKCCSHEKQSCRVPPKHSNECNQVLNRSNMLLLGDEWLPVDSHANL